MVDFLDGAIQTATQTPKYRLDGVGSGVASKYGVFLDGVQVVGSVVAAPVGAFEAQTYSTNVTSTSTILTTSTPTSSDGTLMFSQSFTPEDASSEIIIDVSTNTNRSTASNFVLCLFEDGVLIDSCGHAGSASQALNPSGMWVVPAGSTSSRTYMVRWAPNAGTGYINGHPSDATPWGDTLESTLTIEEILP